MDSTINNNTEANVTPVEVTAMEPQNNCAGTGLVKFGLGTGIISTAAWVLFLGTKAYKKIKAHKAAKAEAEQVDAEEETDVE